MVHCYNRKPHDRLSPIDARFQDDRRKLIVFKAELQGPLDVPDLASAPAACVLDDGVPHSLLLLLLLRQSGLFFDSPFLWLIIVTRRVLAG